MCSRFSLVSENILHPSAMNAKSVFMLALNALELNAYYQR